MKMLLSMLLLLITLGQGFAQPKTYASFMAGTRTAPNWEKLEFDVATRSREIRYSFKGNEVGYRLKTLGTKRVGANIALIIRIPNLDRVYLVIRDKKQNRLLMVSEDNTYSTYFMLGYDGPANGIGAACERCAREPDDAFKIVDSFF
jgi:hypothetical protein